jgi:hypothetical protein
MADDGDSLKKIAGVDRTPEQQVADKYPGRPIETVNLPDKDVK